MATSKALERMRRWKLVQMIVGRKSPQELADAVGVCRKTVYRWTNYCLCPSDEQFQKVLQLAEELRLIEIYHTPFSDASEWRWATKQ